MPLQPGQEPAFPINVGLDGTDGLSKREYFAGQAMQAIVNAEQALPPERTRRYSNDAIANRAVEIADALIARLQQQ